MTDGIAAAEQRQPAPNAVTVTITPASGPAISGVLVEQVDFYVTFRQAGSTMRGSERARK